MISLRTFYLFIYLFTLLVFKLNFIEIPTELQLELVHRNGLYQLEFDMGILNTVTKMN